MVDMLKCFPIVAEVQMRTVVISLPPVVVLDNCNTSPPDHRLGGLRTMNSRGRTVAAHDPVASRNHTH